MQNGFFATWGEAAITALGFFWMALWAFVLGYVVSSMIQVFVTKERMKQTMGEAGGQERRAGDVLWVYLVLVLVRRAGNDEIALQERRGLRPVASLSPSLNESRHRAWHRHRRVPLVAVRRWRVPGWAALDRLHLALRPRHPTR